MASFEWKPPQNTWMTEPTFISMYHGMHLLFPASLNEPLSYNDITPYDAVIMNGIEVLILQTRKYNCGSSLDRISSFYTDSMQIEQD